MRIEWPSGTVQELHDVAARQALTIVEPPRLQVVGRQADGSFQFQLSGAMGQRYGLETSSDLAAWKPWMNVTNTSRTILIADPIAANSLQQFYRAVVQ